MKKLFLFLVFLITASALSAQITVTVSGYVTGSNAPAGIQTVSVYYGQDTSMGPIVVDTVLTDTTGYYTSTKTILNLNTQGVAWATTYCNGSVVMGKDYFFTGHTNLRIDLACMPPIPACYANFVYYSYPQSNYVAFGASPSHSPNASYSWDFGDGSTGYGAGISHIYANPGTYIVCLTVSDSIENCSSTYCDTIKTVIDTIINNCFASFDYKNIGDDEIAFAAGNANPISNAYYHWDFGDGSTGSGQVTSHQYPNQGYFVVCLTVIDSMRNCFATSCQTIFVRDSFVNPLCDASFGIYMNVDSFGTNYSIYVYPYTMAPGYTYNWSMGDGTNSNSMALLHTYAGPGIYNICLVISDSSNNCSDSTCTTIELDGDDMNIVLGMKGAEKNVSIGNLYPNPVENMMNIQLNSVKNDNGTLIIRDLMGREVYSESKEINAGANEWNANVSGLPAGVYFIEIRNSSTVTGAKFIKK